MEEVDHFVKVLEETQQAIIQNNSIKLRELSNQTIHSASCVQDSSNLALVVIIYTISKLIERNDHIRIKNWDKFIKRFNGILSLAIKALREKKYKEYETYISQARTTLTSVSPTLKNYIEEIFRKASINKASAIYEHGISLGKTAQLLGVTQWELAEYSGQKKIEEGYKTIDAKKRAKMAMEFLS
ncbi:hypothetical protein COU54_05825 [Candidatus Pacearchaeota archaeon CG10_big_fil_rev_8_21_14_0_10_31_24]|nr:MAG: hypothetical protein COU54_05825 [Candidatus Pacearchaeota archaeon CG10_big_fil_rev_8_21_14_0_10_31_24]